MVRGGSFCRPCVTAATLVSLLPAVALLHSCGVAFAQSPAALCQLRLPWETILFYFCLFNSLTFVKH